MSHETRIKKVEGLLQSTRKCRPKPCMALKLAVLMVYTPISKANDIKHQQYASNHFLRHIQRHSSMFLLILQEACGVPRWVMGLVRKEHAGNFREKERSARGGGGRRRGASLRSIGGKSSGYRSKLHNGQEDKE